MTETRKSQSKGVDAEEALRDYFLSLGYFTVRNIVITFNKHEVTDIDLWLYIRPSTLSRELINVDIKNKRIPQVIERIFWAKGVADIFGLSRCIVATKDKRKDIGEFGALNGITVLDGNFLGRITKNFSDESRGRLTEEAFLKGLDGKSISNEKVSWVNLYKNSKQLLLKSLDFNGCNQHLKNISILIHDYVSSEKTNIAALRLLYLLTAYFLLTIDYTSRLFAYHEIDSRQKELEEGLRYGSQGKARSEEIFKTAISLIERFAKDPSISPQIIRKEIDTQLTSYPVDAISEYLSRSEIMKNLFSFAKDFEDRAFQINIIQPSDLPSNLKGIIAILTDFSSIDRKLII